MQTNEKLIVQGSQRSEREPLNSVDPDTFCITWDMNSSWSLQFTAKQDNSLAYAMLDSEASLFWDGQEYIIKQAEPDYSEGVSAKNIVATHVYTELSRVRIYKDYIDQSDPSNNNQTDVRVAEDALTATSNGTSKITQNGNTKTTVTKTDESDTGENQKYYSVDDVLSTYLKGNSLGFTWEVIGNFDKTRIEEITEGSGSDMLSQIVDHWPTAIIYPDNRHIRVYDLNSFQKDHGNRLDYLRNTTEIKLTSDSTSITNEVMCIGARYSLETETETTTESADGGTWGWPFPSVGKGSFTGAQLFGVNAGGEFRQNGFHDGLDFGSVDHPGSEVHAIHGGKVTIKSYGGPSISYYVVTHSDDGYNVEYQEAFSSMNDITVNVGDTVKTGDVIGYRRTDHLHVGVTKASIPGAFSSAFINNGTWRDPESLIEKGADGESEGDTESTSNTVEYYYFRPFLTKVQSSIDKYGEHPMDPIDDSRFTDAKAMEEYALSKLQPEPALSVDVTTFENFNPIAGDVMTLKIKDGSILTHLAVVGYAWYPESPTNPTQLTLNTNPQNILDYQSGYSRKITQALNNVNERVAEMLSNTEKSVWTQNEVNTFGSNLELHQSEQSTSTK